MLWLVVAKERMGKQGAVAEAFHAGFNKLHIKTTVVVDEPPVPEDPFIASGQLWVVERIVPRAMKNNQPFWLVDNGYYKTSGKGRGQFGHYEVTYKGLCPILMEDPDYRRFPAEDCLHPWRRNKGGYVLLAMPGPSFGQMIGLDIPTWIAGIKQRIRKYTNPRSRHVRSGARRPSLMTCLGPALS